MDGNVRYGANAMEKNCCPSYKNITIWRLVWLQDKQTNILIENNSDIVALTGISQSIKHFIFDDDDNNKKMATVTTGRKKIVDWNKVVRISKLSLYNHRHQLVQHAQLDWIVGFFFFASYVCVVAHFSDGSCVSLFRYWDIIA